MNNKKFLLVINLIIFSSNVQSAKILDSKIFSKKVTDCDMHKAKLIIGNNHDNAIIAMHAAIYTKDNFIRMQIPEEYCCNFLGGYVNNDQFNIIFDDVNTINIYTIRTKPELMTRIESDSSYDKIVIFSEQNHDIYLFGHYLKTNSNPVRMILQNCIDLYSYEPVLAKIKDGNIEKQIRPECGVAQNESYVVEEVVAEKDLIHFFGFRNIDIPNVDGAMPIKAVRADLDGYSKKVYGFANGDYYIGRDITKSVILYYSDYNLNKEKNARRCKIYENIPGYNEKADAYFDYGVISADGQDDDIFAVFSWNEINKFKRGKYKQPFDINNVNSSIYFWQCDDKSYGKAEKIADGFCPLVRADQFGRVHVFYVDRNGNIVQKVRTSNKWSNEEIILSGFSTKESIIYTKACTVKTDKKRPEAILYTKFIAAEFDIENNLHIVYPTAEGIVYTKMKLD
jgi:hypothetical protein